MLDAAAQSQNAAAGIQDTARPLAWSLPTRRTVGGPARSRSTQKRDQSCLLFQPYPLWQVCAKLMPLAGLKVEG